MKKSLAGLAVLLLLIAPLTACSGAAQPQASNNPDFAHLVGQWQQFIPIASLPEQMELTEDGGATVDGENSRWQLVGDQLRLRTGIGQHLYSYTLTDDYLLTLVDEDEEASAYYINPAAFAASADSNDQLKGQWGSFDSFARLDFDGRGKLNDVVYTSAGETALERSYAAQDGILQSVDTDGNYTYNLFSFSPEGALLMAESSEFDNENKQWTAYWKLADPPQNLLGQWKTALVLSEDGAEPLPYEISLAAGGVGSVTDTAGDNEPISWRYYGSDFIEWTTQDHTVSYAHCDRKATTLYLNNTDGSQCWYLSGAFKSTIPTVKGLAGFVGLWKVSDSAVQLKVEAGGKLTFRDGQGKDVQATAVAQDGLIKVSYEGKYYYMYAEVQDGVLAMMFGDLPFWNGVVGQPLELNKAG